MKNNKNLHLLAIIILLVFSFNIMNIKALKLGGKLINGPRNITYTVNGGAAAYTANINGAVYNWMYTGYDNPIYMTPVSSLNGSTIDFYSAYISYPEYFLAGTVFYDAQSISMNNDDRYRYENWLWAEVHINDRYKYDYSTNHYAVMAHEFGHTLGLDENNSNRYSIMCQNAYYPLVTTPQYSDSEEIVEMYGRY